MYFLVAVLVYLIPVSLNDIFGFYKDKEEFATTMLPIAMVWLGVLWALAVVAGLVTIYILYNLIKTILFFGNLILHGFFPRFISLPDPSNF